MPDPTLRLKYYRETGQTELAQKYEQYLRETGQMQSEAPQIPTHDPEPIEPGMVYKVLGTIAATGRDIPGVEAAQAGIRSLIRRQPYREALSDIRGAEDAAPALARNAARFGGAALAQAALPGGAAAKGAQYGALTGALSSDPNSGLTSRAIGAGFGAGFGYLGGKYVGKAADKLAPATGRVRDAVTTRFALRDAVRPAVRLGEASAPKAEGFVGNGMGNLADAAADAGPLQLAPRRAPLHLEPAAPPEQVEGFVANSMDNVVEAAKARSQRPTLNDLYNAEAFAADAARETPAAAGPRIGDVVDLRNAPGGKGWDPPWGRPTKGQLAWRSERFKDAIAQRNAGVPAPAASGEIADLPPEDLLTMSLEHIRQGGSLKSAADALRAVRRP